MVFSFLHFPSFFLFRAGYFCWKVLLSALLLLLLLPPPPHAHVRTHAHNMVGDVMHCTILRSIHADGRNYDAAVHQKAAGARPTATRSRPFGS